VGRASSDRTRHSWLLIGSCTPKGIKPDWDRSGLSLRSGQRQDAEHLLDAAQVTHPGLGGASDPAAYRLDRHPKLARGSLLGQALPAQSGLHPFGECGRLPWLAKHHRTGRAKIGSDSLPLWQLADADGMLARPAVLARLAAERSSLTRTSRRAVTARLGRTAQRTVVTHATRLGRNTVLSEIDRLTVVRHAARLGGITWRTVTTGLGKAATLGEFACSTRAARLTETARLAVGAGCLNSADRLSIAWGGLPVLTGHASLTCAARLAYAALLADRARLTRTAHLAVAARPTRTARLTRTGSLT
jgi:hypothetical protein